MAIEPRASQQEPDQVPDARSAMRTINLMLARIALMIENLDHDRARSRVRRPPGIDRLTPRERQVIRLVCDAREWKYTVIAGRMRIHPGTFNVHLAGCFRKLEVHSRSGLVRVAVTWGLV